MQTNKINSKQQKRHSSLNFAAGVCVYWYTGLPLVCYMENIRVIYVFDENILPDSVCLAINLFVV